MAKKRKGSKKGKKIRVKSYTRSRPSTTLRIMGR